MFKLYVLEVLVAASLWVAVVSKPGPYELLWPSKTSPPIAFEIGNYIEDARLLQSVGFNKVDHGKVTRNFTENFMFPSVHTDVVVAALELRITRIVVLVEKTDAEQKVEVNIKNGGINCKSVELEIKVQNSYNLNYKVLVYGPSF